MISFSGGRTSAFMTWWAFTQLPSDEYEVVAVFANTGQEHEETLKFVHRFQRHFRIPIVWVEAVVDPEEGKGIRHRVVTYRTAAREGKPFEDMIRKYGLPGSSRPFCSKYLKLRPILSYMRSIDWPDRSYAMAIGIRADEIDRINPHFQRDMIWYPLIKLGIRKPDVLTWWSQQPFDLALEEHQGNCVWCWKKSMRKHLTLIQQNPEFFDFPKRMEKLYSEVKNKEGMEPKRMFRGMRTTKDLFKLAKRPFNSFKEGELEESNGCSESCEVFAPDMGLEELFEGEEA